MSQRSRDVRNVVVGLLTGAVVTLAMGQAAAPDRRQDRPQAVPRYQITAVRENTTDFLFILDHQTQKVYRRNVSNMGDAPTVEQLIRG